MWGAQSWMQSLARLADGEAAGLLLVLLICLAASWLRGAKTDMEL